MIKQLSGLFYKENWGVNERNFWDMSEDLLFLCQRNVIHRWACVSRVSKSAASSTMKMQVFKHAQIADFLLLLLLPQYQSL